MRSSLITLLYILILTGCSTRDAEYYQMHPKELQHSLQACSGESSVKAGVSCDELEAIAEHTNQLVRELQLNPQEFGLKILSLQQTLATLDSQNESAVAIRHELRQRLAIVRWLESPESI